MHRILAIPHAEGDKAARPAREEEQDDRPEDGVPPNLRAGGRGHMVVAVRAGHGCRHHPPAHQWGGGGDDGGLDHHVRWGDCHVGGALHHGLLVHDLLRLLLVLNLLRRRGILLGGAGLRRVLHLLLGGAGLRCVLHLLLLRLRGILQTKIQ